jgi:hypothetical protein
MRLADRIAQCRTPFIVQNTKDGSITPLNGAAAFANDINGCATRYVLSDELASLCTALAYSKGASTLACADLLHVPAERVWVEWAEAPWRNELARYGFKNPIDSPCSGRRGVFIQSTPQGRRGLLRTFWADGESEWNVLSSSMEAYFDFDTRAGEDPEVCDRQERSSICVADSAVGNADILRRCFRFRFERSWQNYYENAQLTSVQATALTHHVLGTIAIDLPVLLAFFLLLAMRPGLPRRPLMLERLNKARAKSGKAPLLEQIEVFAPLLPEYRSSCSGTMQGSSRRFPRLHHVRGHLVRRGSSLFWRVPHLRGNARAGSIRTRTVIWQFAPASPPSRISDNSQPSAARAADLPGNDIPFAHRA